jgi:hypothetical protein
MLVPVRNGLRACPQVVPLARGECIACLVRLPGLRPVQMDVFRRFGLGQKGVWSVKQYLPRDGRRLGWWVCWVARVGVPMSR